MTNFNAVKIKVLLTPKQEDLFKRNTEELKTLWNTVREIFLHNHCLQWYKWAAKQKVDLTGIIPVPLYFGKSPWVGASCRIARGGNYWKKNDKGEYELKEGETPWERIEIVPHSCRVVLAGKYQGQEMTAKTVNCKVRLSNYLVGRGGNPLTLNCKWVDGLFGPYGFFSKSWKAWLNTKNKNAKCPKKKTDKSVDDIKNLACFFPIELSKKGDLIKIPDFGNVTVIDKNWRKRLGENLQVRTFHLTQEPSGYYLCLVVATTNDQELGKGLSCGIDVGVTDFLALDNGHLFRGNTSVKKLVDKIEESQQKIDTTTSLKKKKILKERVSRLYEQVRNSRKNYNHKLTTRLSRTYDHIAVEKIQIGNMTRRAKPKEDPNQAGNFLPNGGSAKSGLNKSILGQNWGQFREQLKYKIERKGGTCQEVDPKNSSQNCHNCGEKGERKGKVFTCTNPECSLHGQRQDADVNAAKNIKIRAKF